MKPVLVSIFATVGRTAILGTTAATNQAIVGVVPQDRSAVDVSYLRRYIDHSIRELADQARGVAQLNINSTILKSLGVPLPSLHAQQRIAMILDRADAIRRKREEGIRLTEELLRSTFLDIFGDPATNPKGWPVVAFGEVIADGPQNGLYRPASEYGSGVRIVRIDGFQGGAVLTPEAVPKRVRLEDDQQRLYGLRNDDILINRVNSRSHLGKAAVVTGLLEQVVFESNMMRVSLDSRRALSPYVLRLLGHASLVRQIQAAAKDAVNQASINQTDVKAFRLPLPPVELQRKYAELFHDILQLRERRERAQMEHTYLFSSLVQRAFRGEL